MLWLLLLLITYLFPLVTSNQACSVCRTGISIPADSINKTLTIPGLEDSISTCGDLQTLAQFLDTTDSRCALIQSIGSLCGCEIQSDACKLCSDGSSIPKGFVSTMVEDVPPQAKVNTLLPPQCGILEASLHTVSGTSDTCAQARQAAEGSCGCPVASGSSPNQSQDPQVKITQSSICSLCRDGDSVLYPTKDLSPFLSRNAEMLQQSLPAEVDLSAMGPLTCQNVAGFMASIIPGGTDQCSQMQTLLGGQCGCPAVDGHCKFCPNDVDIPDPDRLIYSIQGITGGPLFSCSEFNLTLTQTRGNSDQCYIMKQANYLCGCNDGDRHYNGADTEVKRAFLVWIARISGLLSLMGSLWIITDIARNRRKREKSLFHQLVFFISLFDCCTSTTFILGSAPIPEYQFGEPTDVYGAVGTEGRV